MKFKKTLASILIFLSLSSIIFPSITTLKVFANDNVYTSQVSEFNREEHEQIDNVANILQQMFKNGVTEQNFAKYVYNNFSSHDILNAEKELETNINNPYARVPWNQMGSCIAGKIRDEFFAMIDIAVIVKFVQKKAWNELAKVLIRFVKANGLKTNVYIVAGQLAVWAVQCGVE